MRSTSRFIYCYRNPKDVAVSYWNHIKTLRALYGDKAADFTFTEFFEKIFTQEKVCDFAFWEDHVMHWLKEANTGKILFLSYEDLSENTERELNKIISFLELSVTQEHIAHVLEASSFETMKDNKAVNIKHITGNNGDFVRKGKVGGWAETLTEEQSACLDVGIQKVRKAGGYIRCNL